MPPRVIRLRRPHLPGRLGWLTVAVIAAANVAGAGLVLAARGSAPDAARRAGAAGVAVWTDSQASRQPATVGRTNNAANTPQVAPLNSRIIPDVLIWSSHTLAPAEIGLIERVAQARAAEIIDGAQIRLGGGTTDAIGVDPSTYRTFAPAGTAESNPLWQSVAGGNAAVAHAVARALAIPLGSSTLLGVTTEQSVRIGAYATTGLPGVGVVVNRAVGAEIGLVHNAGLILTSPGQDPVVTAAIVRQALGAAATVTPLRVPLSGGRLQWVAPAYGPITSPFGPRADPLHPGHFGFHDGIDIGAPFGSPIYAAADGFVQYAGPAPGFGQEIVLTHADGVTTVYGHMERILVTSGPVTAGQPIALVGAEGDATGPHLHFEVHVDDVPIDPLAWLEAHGVRIER